MTDQTEPPEGGTTGAQLDYDNVEEIIDIVEDDLDTLEDEVLENFEADVEDIEDRLDDIDSAIDDAQDGEGENPLGPVPAQLDYVQRIAEIVEEETDLDSADDVEQGLESLEEALDGIDVDGQLGRGSSPSIASTAIQPRRQRVRSTMIATASC